MSSTSTKIPAHPFKFFWYMTRGFRFSILLFFIFVVAGGVFDLLLYYVIQQSTDNFLVASSIAEQLSVFQFWALMFILVRLSIEVFGIVNINIVRNIEVKLLPRNFETILKYVSRHSHSYFINHFAGSTSYKMDRLVEAVSAYYRQIIKLGLSIFITAVGSTVLFFSVHFLLGITISISFLLIILFNYYAEKKRFPYFLDYIRKSTENNGKILDFITNIMHVRQFSNFTNEIGGVKKEINKEAKKEFKDLTLVLYINIVNSILYTLFTAVSLVVMYYLFTKGLVTIGDAVLIFALTTRAGVAFRAFRSLFTTYIKVYGDLKEALEDVIIPHEVVDTPNAKKLELTNGVIELDKVSFSYEKKDIFESFDLSIKGKQRVGLVGTSGAGKSTLVSLLLRQHNLKDGKILIDNQDISKIKQNSLRESIALVPQDISLFHRSIYDNISFGNLKASKAEVIEASKKAQADVFIDKLPDGYKTIVGERGIKLSTGERQRIAIARAILKNAPILILDEATSALDSENELYLQKALSFLMRGKTVVVIAHRLSTLRQMDRIIVLREGKIAEDGLHSDLIEKNGIYKSLWDNQSKGFL